MEYKKRLQVLGWPYNTNALPFAPYTPNIHMVATLPLS